VALNCVANGKVLRDGRFDRLWIQPAAGDAAGAVGAALAALHQFKGGPRSIAATDGMSGAFLGEDDMIEATAKALSDQLAVGWFQGRMEFGPRSLGGARSSAIPVRQPCKEPQSQGEVP
jgi:carbamoyltransferase